MTDQSGAFPETLREAALWEALKTYGQHRVGCPHPSCPDCRTHTMAASKTPGYSYCTRCGRGSIPTSDEACDCGFEAALERPRPAPPDTLESVTAWLNANDWWDFSTVELATRILKRLRGGAAQPPPSAPEPEPLDDICLKPPPGPERDAKTRVVIPLTEYRALIEENKRLRGSEPGPWSVRNFAADREPNGDWNIVANNGALRWCAAHLATEAEANEIRDALNRLAAVSGVPREETNPHE